MNNQINRETRQKTVILDYLRNVKTHPTAEAVYLVLKKEIPRLSLGTVYRNLENFKKQGLIKEINFGGRKRFDGDISFHSHFICEKCLKIKDLFFSLPGEALKQIKKENVSIGEIDLKIKGRCKDCK